MLFAPHAVVLEKWSDNDFLYAYRINPGPLLSYRDLVSEIDVSLVANFIMIIS